MLQRTPTYVMPVPKKDPVANALRRLLGEERGYASIRRKNIAQQRAVWRFCQRYPKAARRLIRWINTRQLPAGYPVDEHFNPPYGPWDQRLCAVPDGDLFKAIRKGTASVVTDRIATFTERGVLLASGSELAADVIVTATGLNVQAFGGLALTVDGAPVHLPDTVAYKGMMLSGVPNLAFAIGYTNSSWTLKVGLLCEHFCRLLAHMDAAGHDRLPTGARRPGMPTRPVPRLRRRLHPARRRPAAPTGGPDALAARRMDYHSDVKLLRAGRVDDPELRFSRSDAEVSCG